MNMTPREFSLRMDLAKLEAARLRREAMTALWADAARALRRAGGRLRSHARASGRVVEA